MIRCMTTAQADTVSKAGTSESERRSVGERPAEVPESLAAALRKFS